MTGTALLTLINAGMPANAAHKNATPYRQAPFQRQWSGSSTRVNEVEANSAADRAGLRPGDVIVRINGSPIDTSDDIDQFIASGRPITIEVDRGGKLVRLRATPRLVSESSLFGGAQQHRELGFWHNASPSEIEAATPPDLPAPPAPDPPMPVINPPIIQN
jgi:membrane-associated protease RseP (regulator of RpoE activity)